MASSTSPTVRRRRLAAELRRLRGSRTAAPIASALGWSAAKISRYELGRTSFPIEEVAKLLDFYRVTDPQRGQLLSLAEDANQRGWWEDYADAIPPEYAEFIGLEAEAASVIHWAVTGIPGLLQTEEYAREVHLSFQSAVPRIPPSFIDRRVRVRMIRQQVLTARNPQLQLSVVLDESALLRRIGDRKLMNAQLRHLATLMELPNVEVRILPLISGSAPPPGPFQVFGFAPEGETATLGDVVSMEGLTDNLQVEGETDTFSYRLFFQKLVDASLPEDESLHFVLQSAERCWA